MIYTIQCGYHRPYSTTVQVEAATVGEACTKAVEVAGDNDGWKDIADLGPTYVERIVPGAVDNAWDDKYMAVPIPREHDEPWYLLSRIERAAPSLITALRDCWWFIENVTEDTPDRTARFFALREQVREAIPNE